MKDWDARLNKWFFTHFNKKEPKMFDAYTNVVAPWIVVGIWFIMGIIFIILPFSADEFTKTFSNYAVAFGGGLFFVLVSIYFAYMAIQSDKKSGMAVALKEFAVKRWHEERKKYGLE